MSQYRSTMDLFQSTPPCGGDLEELAALVEAHISIHAPLRGRPGMMPISWMENDFNPRPLAGATRTRQHIVLD